MDKFFSLMGRIAIAAIFILSAVSKIGNFAGTVQYMEAHSIPAAPFFLYGAVLFEFLGGVLVASGYRSKVGALILIIFLIPTTIIFHGKISDRVEMVNLMKNLSILGSLVFIFSNGPGKWAIGKGQ